jgi:hypothetical protein
VYDLKTGNVHSHSQRFIKVRSPNRNFFDEDFFDDRQLEGINLKVLRRDKKDEAVETLLNWYLMQWIMTLGVLGRVTHTQALRVSFYHFEPQNTTATNSLQGREGLL